MRKQSLRRSVDITDPIAQYHSRYVIESHDVAMQFISRSSLYVCGQCINNPHDMIVRHRRNLKLPHFTYHQLRHTFASVALNNGMSIRDVADLLGHANSKTTMLYLHGMKSNRANEAANGIESYIAQ